jgi:hypothetical protein
VSTRHATGRTRGEPKGHSSFDTADETTLAVSSRGVGLGLVHVLVTVLV